MHKYMSERELRRRVLANRRASSSSRRAPKPSPSPSPLRRRARPPTLKRSNSEPSLLTDGVEAQANEVEDEGGVLYRPQTCTDIFHSPENLVGRCNNELFNKDAKVVVSVTVEGSPGPIRTMVRLGSNVEETIKLVIEKYNEEGRTPRLSKEAASNLQLHSSRFSLQSLSRSDLIGDVGSRSFYLHKCGCNNNSNSFRMDNESVASSNQSDPMKFLFIRPRFIDRKFWRFVRNFRKIMGCLPCT